MNSCQNGDSQRETFSCSKLATLKCNLNGNLKVPCFSIFRKFMLFVVVIYNYQTKQFFNPSTESPLFTHGCLAMDKTLTHSPWTTTMDSPNGLTQKIVLQMSTILSYKQLLLPSTIYLLIAYLLVVVLLLHLRTLMILYIFRCYFRFLSAIC